ncbi:MAG: GSCFA domain-containing protein [Leadbetterella sp.]
MKTTTPVQILASEKPWNVNTVFCTLGSCFSDNFGAFLAQNKVKVLSNPFGNVYNVVSLSKIVEMAFGKLNLEENRFVNTDGVWYHYDFHSQHCALSENDLRSTLTSKLLDFKDWILRSDVLVLTLGTSWAYTLQDSKAKEGVVSNCHKQKSDFFSKSILDLDTQKKALLNVIEIVRSHNPSLEIVLTVSPVRHIKDGLVENSISKASLLLVCQEVIQKTENVLYFPSYEIMMDELRDYRYYSDDLLHPSKVAVDYILSRLVDTCFDKPTQLFFQEWQKIVKGLQHRPFNSNTQKHRQFLDNLMLKLQEFTSIVDTEFEIEAVKQQLGLNLKAVEKVLKLG